MTYICIIIIINYAGQSLNKPCFFAHFKEYMTLPEDQYYDKLPDEQSVTITSNSLQSVTINSYDKTGCEIRQCLLR